MRGDTLQTFEKKKFENNVFSFKKSQFQVNFCYKKLMRGDTQHTFQKQFQNTHEGHTLQIFKKKIENY